MKNVQNLAKIIQKLLYMHACDDPETNWEQGTSSHWLRWTNWRSFFLICVDAKSKWIEVCLVKDSPTSSSSINLHNNIFSFHSYPSTLDSDNATIFLSEKFRLYCVVRGISQKFISPSHPAINGLAERNDQILKHHLKPTTLELGNMCKKFQRFLFRYRATPIITTCWALFKQEALDTTGWNLP